MCAYKIELVAPVLRLRELDLPKAMFVCWPDAIEFIGGACEHVKVDDLLRRM